MDVCDEGNLDPLTYDPEGLRSVHGRRRNADDIRPGLLERADLSDGRLDVSGLCVRHALDGDRRAASNRHITNVNLPRLPALDGIVRVHERSSLQRPSVRLATSLRVNGRNATRDPL